jgi:hypothetical protein
MRRKGGTAVIGGRKPDTTRMLLAAALACALLLPVLAGCADGNPKGVYRAFYRIEPPESKLATLDMGAAYEMIIDDRYYVSAGKYGTVKLPAGTHRIRWSTSFGVSVIVEPSGYAAFDIASEVSLEADHTYKFFVDRTTGHGYRVYHWIEDTTSGRIVQGEKKP